MLKLQSDATLVALTRGGNEHAFAALVERYRLRLLGFCRQMLSSAEDAEDVLQESFVAAYNAMVADERPIAVRPWLYRICRNRCLNHLRKPVPVGEDTMDVHVHDNGTSTYDRAQRREEFRNLIEDVGELPETQRTALVLREMEAMSYEEIAQSMDTTVPSVKSLLVRARMGLAESSQARALTCDEVRLQLAEAAEGLGKLDGAGRRHVRGCKSCRGFRTQLRSNSKALAALFPIGPFVLFKGFLLSKLGAASGSGAGGGAATAGGAGAAAAGSSGAAGVAGVAIGTKAVAGLATAALLTAGAVEVKYVAGDRGPSYAPPPALTLEAPQHGAAATERWADKRDKKRTRDDAVVKPTPVVSEEPETTTADDAASEDAEPVAASNSDETSGGGTVVTTDGGSATTGSPTDTSGDSTDTSSDSGGISTDGEDGADDGTTDHGKPLDANGDGILDGKQTVIDAVLGAIP